MSKVIKILTIPPMIAIIFAPLIIGVMERSGEIIEGWALGFILTTPVVAFSMKGRRHG